MNEMPVTPEQPKKNKSIFIWVGAALALCCCCLVGVFVMYQYLGDQIVKALGF